MLPELSNPMNETGEAFKIRFFERGETPDDVDLSTAIRGISKLDETMSAVNDVRDKLMRDNTLNEAGKKAEYLRYVKKKGNDIHQNIENVTKIVDRRSSEISDIINKPINEEAGGRDASDIRDYVRSLKQKERFPWIQARIDAGDFESASAALGSKFYLAGLSEEMHQNLMTYYRKKRFSDLMKVQESLDKIGESMMNKTVIVSNFRKKIETPDSLSALESRRAREEATS